MNTNHKHQPLYQIIEYSVGSKRLLLFALALLIVVLSYQPTYGQPSKNDPPKAEKYKNVTWYEVEQIALKSRKRDEVLNLLKKYYKPAGDQSGDNPVMLLEHHTGPWDLTIIFPMKGGPADMEWERSSKEVAWYKALVKVAGSTKKAHKILDTMASDTQRINSYIALQEDVFAGGGK